MEDILAYQLKRQRFFKKLQAIRFVSENILVTLLQYIGLTFSLSITRPLPFSFAAGTAIAFIFMRGLNIIPGIWLGTFLAFTLSQHTILYATSTGALVSVQTAIIYLLCHYYKIESLIFFQIKSFLKFLLITAVVTLFNVSDVLGILFFAIPIITWDYYFPDLYDLKLNNPIKIAATLFVTGFLINMAVYLDLPVTK